LCDSVHVLAVHDKGACNWPSSFLCAIGEFKAIGHTKRCPALSSRGRWIFRDLVGCGSFRRSSGSLQINRFDSHSNMRMSSLSGGISSTGRPSLCAAQHSQLQQEWEYLQQALAVEGRRKERLIAALKNAEARLSSADQSKPVPAATRSPKKSLRSLRSELNRCIKTEQALSGNLANVSSRMQRLGQYQRRRHQEYAQQGQHTVMNVPTVAPGWTAVVYTPAALEPVLPLLSVHAAMPTGYLYSSAEQSMVGQTPHAPVLRPLQFVSPLQSYTQLVISAPGHALPVHDVAAPISPTDSISSCNLSPWATIPPNLFPPMSVPTAQCLDVVGSLNNLYISSQEDELRRTRTRSKEDEALVSGQGSSNTTHCLCLLDAHSTALRLNRRARKRRSC